MPKQAKTSKIALILGIFVLILFLHFLGITKPIESLITQAINYPLSNFRQNTTISTQTATDNTNYKTENQLLKLEILLLKSNLAKLQEELINQQALNEQSKYLIDNKLTYIPAQVVARGIDQNENLIIINQGTSSGIQKDMAVVIEKGQVIGKIVAVKKNIAHILLLNDSDSSLSAAIPGIPGSAGLLKGDLDISLKLEMVDKKIDIKKGDLLITSGNESQIPRGLFIGQVEQITEDERELFKTGIISQPLSTDKITIVSIVLP